MPGQPIYLEDPKQRAANRFMQMFAQAAMIKMQQNFRAKEAQAQRDFADAQAKQSQTFQAGLQGWSDKKPEEGTKFQSVKVGETTLYRPYDAAPEGYKQVTPSAGSQLVKERTKYGTPTTSPVTFGGKTIGYSVKTSDDPYTAPTLIKTSTTQKKGTYKQGADGKIYYAPPDDPTIFYNTNLQGPPTSTPETRADKELTNALKASKEVESRYKMELGQLTDPMMGGPVRGKEERYWNIQYEMQSRQEAVKAEQYDSYKVYRQQGGASIDKLQSDVDKSMEKKTPGKKWIVFYDPLTKIFKARQIDQPHIVYPVGVE